MKKIEAIIQPQKLESVKAALIAIGVDGITVSEVRGHGRQKGHKEVYRGMEYNVDLLPKLKIEVVIQSARVNEVIAAVMTAAKPDRSGTERFSSRMCWMRSGSATTTVGRPRSKRGYA